MAWGDRDDRAGIFEERSDGPWTWTGNRLLDPDDRVLASVSSDVIYYGADRLLIESDPGPIRFRARATTGDGRVFTMAQAGFTVGVLEADCDGRSYQLRRTSIWRKEREIVGDNGVVAWTRPLISGRVAMYPGPARDDLPVVDAVFLSWGCVLVDSPVRHPRV